MEPKTPFGTFIFKSIPWLLKVLHGTKDVNKEPFYSMKNHLHIKKIPWILKVLHGTINSKNNIYF